MRSVETLLRNVEIKMLPRNTILVLQSIHSAVMSCLKACFRRMQGCHAVDAADSVIDDDKNSAQKIYIVDVLKAMHWCCDACEAVTQSTIENCWKHTDIIPESCTSSFKILRMLYFWINIRAS